MGIVGVGFGVDTIQQMLRDYEEEFQVCAYLADKDGFVEISKAYTGF